MDELLIRIAQVKDSEIGEVLTAVLRRYSELFPEWEVSTLSLHKTEDRNAQLDRMIQMLTQLKTNP